MKQEVTNKVFTIANLLSVARLLLLPVFFVLFVVYRLDALGFIVLLVAALTDLVDGYVARATHTVSRLGQQLDPFVDRVFIVVAVFAIFLVGRLPLWLLLALLVRDAAMLVLTVYQHFRLKRAFKVIFLGKVTTVLVMSGFCSLVLWWPLVPGAGVLEASFLPGLGDSSAPLGYGLLYLGAIVSWITAGIYLVRVIRAVPNDRDPDSGSGLSNDRAPDSGSALSNDRDPDSGSASNDRGPDFQIRSDTRSAPMDSKASDGHRGSAVDVAQRAASAAGPAVPEAKEGS
ncbi:MAG: CDP-alcohol phosphatidyltransferase family protein [Coriobacteriales bacterium]|jgi:cardiolipin synthase|nr:CDP-alcohol phosphatidyltransferase family protein [Coriobacteriales bacterium]